MPRRRKAAFVTFSADPYGCLVSVALGATTRALLAWLDSEACEVEAEDREQMELGEYDAVTYAIENGRVLIRFKDRQPPTRTICHEAFHATARILDRAGVALSDESEEAWAYLLDSIVERVSEAAG